MRIKKGEKLNTAILERYLKEIKNNLGDLELLQLRDNLSLSTLESSKKTLLYEAIEEKLAILEKEKQDSSVVADDSIHFD